MHKGRSVLGESGGPPCRLAAPLPSRKCSMVTSHAGRAEAICVPFERPDVNSCRASSDVTVHRRGAPWGKLDDRKNYSEFLPYAQKIRKYFAALLRQPPITVSSAAVPSFMRPLPTSHLLSW